MQFRYLVFGLLIAAIVVGLMWANGLPGIPPVRVPENQLRVNSAAEAAARQLAEVKGQKKPLDPLDVAAREASRARSAEEVLPELNASDDWLRDKLIGSALPWLAETELVRTGATVLENASRGELPRQFLGFLAPEGSFEVRKMGELIQIDPQSYKRYEPFVQNLQRVPPKRAAELFGLAEPLLAEALAELGRSDATPRELAYAALGIALDTPRVDAASELRQPKVIYTYADKRLEDLKPLQKQLLRMGPENFQMIRLWLEDFGLELSPASLFDDQE